MAWHKAAKQQPNKNDPASATVASESQTKSKVVRISPVFTFKSVYE